MKEGGEKLGKGALGWLGRAHKIGEIWGRLSIPNFLM